MERNSTHPIKQMHKSLTAQHKRFADQTEEKERTVYGAGLF